MAVDTLSLPYTRPEQAAGRLAACLVALGMVILICFAPQIFNDGDTGWHLTTGRLILDSQSIPATDPFSFTAPGKAWTAHEWLAEAIMAAAFGLGGWPALAMLLALLFGGLVLIIGFELARWLNPPKVFIVLMLVIVMLMPSLLIRPHAFAWVLLAGWTVIMLQAREADRPPPLVAALIMLVWANLHGSFVVGLLIAGAFGLEALVSTPDRRAVLIGWGRFGLVALLGALLTPHGVDGLVYPLMVSRMATLDQIAEWEVTNVAKHLTFSLPFLLALFVLLSRGVRVPPLRLLLLCLFVFMAMAHIRHHQLLAIAGSLLIAAPLGHAFGRQAVAQPFRRLPAVLAVGLALVLVARVAIVTPRPPSDLHPAAAIAALPADLRNQPVINEYGFGGSLILAGIAPFIDGRADLYGDDFMRSYRRISNGDIAALNRAADHWHAGWTIFRPTTPIVAHLDADPQWQRRYADKWAVVHVRAAAPALTVPAK